MQKVLLTFILGLILFSCDDKPSQKELKNLFNQTSYDTSIIQKLYLYDSIKNIIVKNIDTIFKFRNSRNIVTYTDEKGKTTQRIENSDFYTFDKDYGHATRLSYGTGPNNQKLIADVNLENMPTFLFARIDRLFNILGEKNIKGFDLWTDSSIEISIKGFYDEKINADVYHTLIWKRVYAESNEPDLFVDDTILAPGWTY